ncbi:MAG TPA: excinuclease ABC subunit UvrC [Candidatus Lumbricidophila sp.]|nr:excinuclease ABC subunit UvrC [Candidatus Lumbricidophila sp.]
MTPTVGYRPATGEIPTTPGVYRFRDDRRVLYVGKAKNLRARLSNYFAPLHTLHERTRRMVLTATSVEWTVVSNDIEALQLEISLINEFKPPFNVQFKDDKSYPYLAVTLADEAPRLLVTRRRGVPGARYFGPYPKVWALNETLGLIRQMFPIRTCSPADYRRAMQTGRPCLASQIGRCAGPCSQRVTVAEHRAQIDALISFIEHQDEHIIGELEQQMHQASATQDYETAARRRDQLRAASEFFEKSAVVLSDHVDADVIGIARDELSAAVHLFRVRAGRVRAVQSWLVDTELDVTPSELVDSALEHVYSVVVPPTEIVVPTPPNDAEAVAAWLRSRAGRKVRIGGSPRGERAALLATANQNAAHALLLAKTRRTSDFTSRSQALEDLQQALQLAEAPLRIECFDVSHLSGTGIVASMVVFEDGLPRKSEYRRFSIDHAADDTDAMAQVLTRRFTHLTAPAGDPPQQSQPGGRRTFSYRPNLILVDGGQPQVAAAARAAEASGVSDIAICGIAKRLEELWLPGADFPVILPRTSEALYLVQRLRDEAHRFAITHQRQRRKRDITTVLSEIPGVGPAKATALLRHFGSVAQLRAATAEELCDVTGIGPTLAATIAERLRR